ncbi:DUF4861 family protein [Parapedobacter indicus]|uniref:DUF4861 domain-containing protein n=1 Tax=Parapedobacter indicus TaxID=1477437 RepID=A0A1I3K7C2_9SPHI|nr:DUF4861 family protein [Parapedobacter indicus]PPL01727.1 uncharacterized protein DUF4861 [Parapedobacter indicus]SFI68085.1 protein of unknown function [Parapedobacter indicus]
MQRTTNLGCLLVVCTLLAACGPGQRDHRIVIRNPMDQERHELVAIPYTEWSDAFGTDSIVTIVDASSGVEIPYQRETKGMSGTQNILLEVTVPASGSVTLAVEKSAPAPATVRTYARYVPERYDDFAWENDVVAFRMYGKALEGRPDDAHGLDIWSKRTKDLVVDKWYAQGDYHTDHGEGMDYYSVGMTLGAGDIAPFANDTVVFSKHYRQYEIVDNGPLRSTFKLTYEPWQVGTKTVSVTKQFTLDAGSQLNRVEVTYSIDGDGELPVAIGVARREKPGSLLQEERDGIFGYWEPEIGNHGITGIGVILEEGSFSGFGNLSNQYLAFAETTNGTPLVYYVGGAWNKAGAYTSAEAWFDYLHTFKERVASPLNVEIN